MAILKHISSKNANYGDAEKYLTFEHDEFTMKPTLDADGRLIPRVLFSMSISSETPRCSLGAFAAFARLPAIRSLMASSV